MILLKDLVTNGTLGEIRIGSQRRAVIDELGLPDSWDGPNTTAMDDADWWTYGDLELHFYDQTLIKIFAMDFVGIPKCGDKNQTDSWILSRTLTPTDLKLQLETENIDFRETSADRLPWHIDIITQPETCLRFVPRDDDLTDHRLFAFWREFAG